MSSRTQDPEKLSNIFREAPRQRSFVRQALGMLRRNRLGAIGALVLLGVVISATFASVLAPHDPRTGGVAKRLHCPVFFTCPVYGTDQTITGSTEHLLGTDQVGRDVLSRLIYGAQVSLVVGISAVLLGAGIGSTLGLVSGFYGRFFDTVIMRIGDIFLAFPQLLFAIAVVAVIGGGLLNVIVVLGIATWVPYARIMRGSVLAARSHDYIIAARAIGVTDTSLLIKHLVPNVATPIIVFGTFAVAATIIAEAGLSFLGLGVGPLRPTWGGMLADGRSYVSTAWWLATFPGLAIMFTVLAINLLGDWVRDFLDPRLRNISD